MEETGHAFSIDIIISVVRRYPAKGAEISSKRSAWDAYHLSKSIPDADISFPRAFKKAGMSFKDGSDLFAEPFRALDIFAVDSEHECRLHCAVCLLYTPAESDSANLMRAAG